MVQPVASPAPIVAGIVQKLYGTDETDETTTSAPPTEAMPSPRPRKARPVPQVTPPEAIKTSEPIQAPAAPKTAAKARKTAKTKAESTPVVAETPESSEVPSDQSEPEPVIQPEPVPDVTGRAHPEPTAGAESAVEPSAEAAPVAAERGRIWRATAAEKDAQAVLAETVKKSGQPAPTGTRVHLSFTGEKCRFVVAKTWIPAGPDQYASQDAALQAATDHGWEVVSGAR